jgi:peptidoglycan/xylan/chitin deacetylase (PgdA/CDA1 family)
VTQPVRPPASVSLDLDNQWSYMKTHGDAGWEAFPSYLDVVVPRVLEFLARRSLTITFFIVGQDAALEPNHRALASIAAAGHEIGNHSFHHEPWLHRYSREQVDAEIALAEEHIERATGRRPIGFRGPGFSVSPSVLDVLVRRGYRYDASTFPTFIGPLARAYYFMTSKLSPQELEQRKALFGAFREGFRPNRPYLWRTQAGELLEIPVTTMPLLRLPMHVSYLLYLGGASKALARAYFRSALALCRLSGTQPSLLLHPLDFLGRDDDTAALAFFPGMQLSSAVKLELVSMALDELSLHYDLVTMSRHAALTAAGRLLVTPATQAGFAQG